MTRREQERQNIEVTMRLLREAMDEFIAKDDMRISVTDAEPETIKQLKSLSKDLRRLRSSDTEDA